MLRKECDKVKALLVSGLTGGNADSIIEPIVNTGIMEKIYFVRDKYYKTNDYINCYPVPASIRKNPNEKKSSYGLKRTSIQRILYKIYIGLRLLKDKDINCIITVLFYPHGFIGFILSKLSRKPWIHVIVAGEREISLYGSFAGFFVSRVLSAAQLITVTGNNTKDFLVKRGIDAKKVIILPNIIRMKNFNKTNSKREVDVVVVTRFYNVKRLDRLVNIITSVKKNYNKISVLIVGEGPEKRNLVNLVKNNKLTDNIKIHGFVQNNEISGIWNKGRLFILTSEGEGFPLTILEAMACGVVCISPSVGDVSDVIKDGKNGFIINDQSDISEYSKHVTALLNNNRLYNKLSEESTKVREMFDYRNATIIWRKIFSSI